MSSMPPSTTSSQRLRPEDYTVGWICPLEVEQTAALEMLDEENPRLPQSPGDHNVYNLGSINGHNVVIAGLHAPGNCPAATVVTQMRNTFPNLRFGLLVGIGGGVPAKTDNGMIHLGDVVVSKPAGGHSGAIQFDHGKAEEGQFKRTGALAPPPTVLLNAAQDLAAQRARSRKDPLAENIGRIDTEIRGLRKFKYPGQENDRLFPSKHTPLDPNLSSEKCGCDSALRIPRETDDDEEEDGEPYIVVHRGTVASGEIVVKNGQLRDELAKEYGILCFEMEAAGALADFPCLVVRGISDYCDSHKNNQWHGYAAAVAAAYARQLFFHMPIDEVKRCVVPPVIEQAVLYLVDRHDDEERGRICDWLSSLRYGGQQSGFIAERQPGTGEWLLKSDEFIRWISETRQTLYCKGIPGAGKTMISAIVVDYLQKEFGNKKDIGIAYIYCNYQPQQEQKVEDLLLSLLKQFAQEQSHLPAHVTDLYQRHKNKDTRPPLDEVVSSLTSIMQLYSRVFVVVDALDEYHVSSAKGQRTLVSKILALQRLANLNFFATSRPNSDIESQFRFTGCQHKEIRARDDDIVSYVNGQIPQLLLGQLSKYAQYAQFQEMIRTAIVEAIDGMFLLARLHIDSLKSQPTIGHIKQALKNLPQGQQGLHDTYGLAMKRIEGQEEGFRELAKRLLSWITYAKTALSIEQIRHAVAVRENMHDMDPDFLPDVEILGSICAGLVTIDWHSHAIRLVHYTTHEYFKKPSSLPNAETDLAVTCMTYLSFDTFATGFCPTDKDFEDRLRLNPLYGYAARHWGDHLLSASKSFQYQTPEFLENEHKRSSCSQAMFDMVWWRSDGYSQSFPRKMTAVHLTACFGLLHLTETLLKNGDFDHNDSYSQTPLSRAARNGHDAVVNLLLATGEVKPDARDEEGRTPL